MQSNVPKRTVEKASWLSYFRLARKIRLRWLLLRSAVASLKGKAQGTAGRGPFDHIMERVAVPEDVAFEAGTIGGIPGWFNLGTAKACRNFARQIDLSAGVNTFIPDYRLAPEHPFPFLPTFP